MAISDRIPPPAFVDLEARSEKGLDVLGLRLPAQQLGEQLLDGVTSVTPTLRYLSLRTWLLWRYATAEPPQPNEYRAFREYVRRAEAAFTIGNLMHGPVPTTLIGSREAPHRIADEADEISLQPLAKQPALGIYAGPSADLSLTKTNPEPPGIPVWDEELAEPLARATDEALAQTALGQRLGRGELLESATRDELEEFGLAAAALDIPEAERSALIDVILPEAPMPHERNRIATYGALLALASNREDGNPLHQDHLFEEAARPERTVPGVFAFILDGWLLYSVRDAIAVSGEFSLRTLETTHRALDAEGAGLLEDVVVASVVEETVADIEGAYHEFGVVPEGDQIETLSFSELARTVSERTSETTVDDGLRRWAGDLTEFNVMQANWGVGRGALGLGVLSWILAERRVLPGLAEDGYWALDRLKAVERHSRLGLEQVILPTLGRWRQSDLSVADALADYAHSVLDQHLRIAWSRMANDPRRDIAVVRRDGQRLLRGASFEPGRAVTRLTQAVGWLEQLRLTENGSITDEGRQVLARVVEALS